MAIEEQTSTAAPAPGGFSAGPAPEAIRPSTAAPGAGGAGVSGVHTLMSQFAVAGGVSPDVEAYITEVKKNLVEGQISITVTRMTEPAGTHLLESGGECILLLFPTAFPAPADPEIARSEYIRVAAANLAQTRPTLRLKNAILVTADMMADPARARNMANHVSRNLMVSTMPMYANLTIDNLSDDNYVVDTNPQSAAAFINSLNPHAVQPRGDLGFVVSVRTPKAPNQQFQQNLVEEAKPLFAVTAFVDVVRRYDQQAGGFKHSPIVRITAIDSMVPLPAIVPLALTMAADQFIVKNGWRSQFGRYVKGAPNLGNLVPDPNDPNKPYFASNQLDRDTFINTHFYPPALAVDVVEGVARIPALANYPVATGAGKILDEVRRFFTGVDVTPLYQAALTSVAAVEVIGYYGDQSGQLRDTRWLSYLDIVAGMGSIEREAEQALLGMVDSRRKQKVVASFAGSGYQPLFADNVTLLSAPFLNYLSGVIGAKLKITQTGGYVGGVSLDYALQQAAAFTGFQAVAVDPTRMPMATVPYYV